MSKRVQLFRGNTAQTSSFVGLLAEIIVDAEAHKIALHDGVTPGGHILATEAFVTSNPIVGPDGKSAYQVAVTNGYSGTEQQWLTSLVGPPGTNGTIGIDGKSAYQVAVANGYSGTEQQWLTSLVGQPGTNGTNGTIGVDGKSAYQVAVANGYSGTEQQWLTSLVGQPGQQGLKGDDGRTAYQVAVATGFTGTELQWVTSLIGPQGLKGDPGTTANIAITGTTISTVNQNEGITINPNGTGEVNITTALGVENSNPGYSIQVGNISEYENTGEIGFSFYDGDLYDGTAHLGWAWDNGAGHGNNITGTKHAKFGIFRNGTSNTPWLTFDIATPSNALSFAANADATFSNVIIASKGIKFNDGTTQSTAIIQGDTGRSAYQIAVDNGFVGTEQQWLTSLTGPIGPAGPGLSTVPSSAIGQAGDTPGLIASDGTYLYYCIALYDGVSNIWNRQLFTGASW